MSSSIAAYPYYVSVYYLLLLLSIIMWQDMYMHLKELKGWVDPKINVLSNLPNTDGKSGEVS